MRWIHAAAMLARLPAATRGIAIMAFLIDRHPCRNRPDDQFVHGAMCEPARFAEEAVSAGVESAGPDPASIRRLLDAAPDTLRFGRLDVAGYSEAVPRCVAVVRVAQSLRADRFVASIDRAGTLGHVIASRQVVAAPPTTQHRAGAFHCDTTAR